MRATPDPLHRDLPERGQAWLVMGPLGHLWSVVADLSVYVVRSRLGRLGR